MEEYEPVEPPEIRMPQELCRQVEFYVALGVPRPELKCFEMALDWLKEQAPLTVISFSFSYHWETTQGEEPLLCGLLVVNAPIDMG